MVAHSLTSSLAMYTAPVDAPAADEAAAEDALPAPGEEESRARGR
jgi:hypothetical protein